MKRTGLLLFILLFHLLFSLMTYKISGENKSINLNSKIDSVQPFTGLVIWENSTYASTENIQLEFSYMLYSDIVKTKGVYDWTAVENVLNKIAANKHQAILRFRFTYPGYKTSVPQYIKDSSGYNETKGKSEGLTTYFPDWSFEELRNFTLEFYTEFAKKYDNDKRLAYLQTGFGLWAEYHIYDGPMILGDTFPSKEFQKTFFIHLGNVFENLYWSVSIDAADESRTPLKSNKELLEIEFGLFDDSFLNKDHGEYNKDSFDFFTVERYKKNPVGGELSYYTDYDQIHALDKNGPHGISFESLSNTYHVTYMIGNDQPDYQPMSRIKEAGMNIGYKFRIKSFELIDTYSKIIVENYGIAPIYYDAFLTVNGIRAENSLKLLLPGKEEEFTINSGGNDPLLTIECDRLVNGQIIQFDASINNTETSYISVSKDDLYFAAITNNIKTGIQKTLVSSDNWELKANASWINYTPKSGSGSKSIEISINSENLSPGKYTGTIEVIDNNASNSAYTITINLDIINSGSTNASFGAFDTPENNSVVMSSIPLTGWALDDLEVETVKIYRDPVSGENNGAVYIGDAVFVDGARPDIETLYANYPLNYRAGWGYMLLTNFLPTGNGIFNLYAKAIDKEGNETVLGTKTINCDNANAVKPFGAIDTPAPGESLSGTYINFGWALTPQPNTIPIDGSKIKVYIDSVFIGNTTYNVFRSDIAALFPDYTNSLGAIGYLSFDTGNYENGVHTIQWIVEDNAGNRDGIGSRYFNIINTGGDKKGKVKSVKALSAYKISKEPIEFKKGFNPSHLTSSFADLHFVPVHVSRLTTHDLRLTNSFADLHFVPVHDSRLTIKELERIELKIGKNHKDSRYSGFLKVGNKLKKLPIGSSLINEKFYWQPGPGFIGNYDLVFIDHLNKTRKEVKISIKPKFDLVK